MRLLIPLLLVTTSAAANVAELDVIERHLQCHAYSLPLVAAGDTPSDHARLATDEFTAYASNHTTCPWKAEIALGVTNDPIVIGECLGAGVNQATQVAVARVTVDEGGSERSPASALAEARRLYEALECAEMEAAE